MRLYLGVGWNRPKFHNMKEQERAISLILLPHLRLPVLNQFIKGRITLFSHDSDTNGHIDVRGDLITI